MLLGAGCSISSNIPSGSQVIEICKKFSFVDNDSDGYTLDKAEKYNHLVYLQKVDDFIKNGRSDKFKNFTANKEKEFLERLTDKEILEKIPENIYKKYESEKGANFKDKLIEDFKEKIFNDSLYGNWLEEFNSDPRERQKLIESIIENQKVSGEYILFANLIHQGLIQNIFTTNFDDLIYESIVTYANDKARVYAHNEIAQYITLGSKKPNVIKLHGDYLFENIMNSNKETAKLAENMGKKMREVLDSLNLIVVGYNGSDSSIMNVLEEIKKTRKYSLIWCGKDINDINWRVKNLLGTTENSFFVCIDDFATLVFKFWSIKKLANVNLDELGKQKQKELSEYLEKFNDLIQENTEISLNEKEAFSDLLKASDLFDAALRETNIEKQITLYTESLKYNSKQKETYLNRGFLYDRLGKYQEAVNDYKMAISIDNKFDVVISNLAYTYLRMGKYQEALETASEALKINPNNFYAAGNKGTAFFWLKQYDKALEWYNKKIDINPFHPGGYSSRGIFYMETGELELAEKDFTHAKETGLKNSDLPFYYNNLAVLYRRKKQPLEALKLIKEIESQGLENSNIYGTLALIYADKKDKENFYKYLEIAFEKGCPVWNYLEDPAFDKYRNDKKLKELLKKYQPK